MHSFVKISNLKLSGTVVKPQQPICGLKAKIVNVNVSGIFALAVESMAVMLASAVWLIAKKVKLHFAITMTDCFDDSHCEKLLHVDLVICETTSSQEILWTLVI